MGILAYFGYIFENMLSLSLCLILSSVAMAIIVKMPSLNTDRELLSFYNFENMLFCHFVWDYRDINHYRNLYFRRYDEDEAKSNRDNQEQSRAALQRYLFYCNR